MRAKKDIIITGFGSFGEVLSNPTEKLIKSLKEELRDELYQLYVLPVSYSYCSSWSEEHISENTSLVIHFGVSATSHVIQLERTGRRGVGSNVDVDGECYQRKTVDGELDSIQTGLDLHLLRQELLEKGYSCEVSDNAGDYLCNFILFNSLKIAPQKSLFVHVPPEDEVSIEELKSFTLELIRSLRSQVK